ncbi:MAG TPA: hypothetical protein VGR63_19255 [Casimicrobiaceae bacterium]|jgi:hypothetical protein|nr:hypothetical protein [Casimicrobiaceae bacterium]
MAQLKIEVTDEDDEEVVFTSDDASQTKDDRKQDVIAALEKALRDLKDE